jgi:hypothetical protein
MGPIGAEDPPRISGRDSGLVKFEV